MTTDICRQPGDGADFCAHAVTRANVNGYYGDPHDATGRFDFVLGNGSMSSACRIH